MGCTGNIFHDDTTLKGRFPDFYLSWVHHRLSEPLVEFMDVNLSHK